MADRVRYEAPAHESGSPPLDPDSSASACRRRVVRRTTSELAQHNLRRICIAALDDGIVHLTIDLTALACITEEIAEVLETMSDALEAYGGGLDAIHPTHRADAAPTTMSQADLRFMRSDHSHARP